MSSSTSFADWKDRANAASMVAAATALGAKLRKAGREHVGPCPWCGGADRFSINPSKRMWNCRGYGGGHGAIGMAIHIAGLTFQQACEELTGERDPRGGVQEMTDAQRRSAEARRGVAKAESDRRRADEARYKEDTRRGAQAVWDGSQSLRDTLAAAYLNLRGIPTPNEWPDVLRFHPGLPYPQKEGCFPALVCRVDDMAGNLTAVWRIFLRADARKLDVESPKLGLGPAGGGAVRLGGVSHKVAVAEGIESAYGYWLLTKQRHPVWAALSTSGLKAVELPLGVEHVVIAPDGDASIKRKEGEFVPAVPAGRVAAQALRMRLLNEGIGCTIAPEPPPRKDYNDLWLAHVRGVAA